MRIRHVLPLVLFAILLGMRHALAVDHVAAVLSLASRSSLRRDATRAATAWGAGHGLTVVAVGSVLITLGTTLPVTLARVLEIAAAAVLIGLGWDVLRRVRGSRITAHVHVRDDGTHYVHSHAHADRVDSRSHGYPLATHTHRHASGLIRRALLVGALQGGAASAGVVLLAVQAIGPGAGALAYLCVLALGTVLGIVALAIAVSLPLRVSGVRLARVLLALDATVGLSSVAVGCWMMLTAAAALVR